MRALASDLAVALKVSALVLAISFQASCLEPVTSREAGAVPQEEASEFDPFKHPEHWKAESRSASRPMVVRFTHESDRAVAERVRAGLEEAWESQVETLGFLPPFPYDPSGRGEFQVFLIRGAGTGVDAVRAVALPGVDWDARESYMVVDAWGRYGDAALESTLHHEFNHALQASYSWEEGGSIYEMSSNYIQEKTKPGLNPDFHLEQRDFQERSRFPIDYYDDYESHAMYGSSIYLEYLEQAYFGGDPKFLVRLWSGMKKKPGQRKPDFARALEEILPPGTSYADTVLEFAAWRAFTGSRDDGKHLKTAYAPEPGDGVTIARELSEADLGKKRKIEGTRHFGTQYILLKRGALESLTLSFNALPGPVWRLQAIPALDGADSELLTLDNGRTTIEFGSLEERLIAITAIPVGESSSVDDAAHDFAVQLN